MCFRWLKRIYHCLRRKCSRRRRGYSREISLSHGGFCSGALSTRHCRGSFTCGHESSVTFTRRPSPCPPPAPYSISGGFSDPPALPPSRDCGVTSGWDATVGTIPVYGPGVGLGYGAEDVGSVGGSIYHPRDLGSAEGAGYGYTTPLSDPLTTSGVTEGSGYYGAGLGYGVGPELGPVATGCTQMVQQKCPVVLPPPVKSQQCKQSPQWPPIQKK